MQIRIVKLYSVYKYTIMELFETTFNREDQQAIL